MGFLAAADPASKTAYIFTETGKLASAIQLYGFIPLDPDNPNRVMSIQEFEGGYLLDGAPINVYIEDTWYEGQRELLEPYWRNGSIPTPSAKILNKGLEEMPEDVRENYEAYKRAQAGISPTTIAIIGAAALGLLLLGGGSKRSRSSDASFA